ncbi:RNA-directed DNA polymerase, eukaryota, reverse transcriptase zinc-binding domain protein, partial [Tanacetum coccineum]
MDMCILHISPVKEIDDCESLFHKRISPEVAQKMISDISVKEIKCAMFDINDSKAPSPDGFTVAFFKKAWNIVGEDVCEAVQEFFSSGRMLGELNATLISLILKTQTPNKVTDFRPIACCNVLYKCISKVITNRIKPVLGMLVSSNQSAFIPGRNIQDNILLTQEIMMGYNRKGGPKRVTLKIDLQKAYDTINWGFQKRTLEEFSFHEKMVHWIMECVSTSSFTLNVNGERIGYFKGGRGLRQGDPISPYLFTLIMEMFSLMLKRQIEKDPNFQYHFGCKQIKLAHVCFADDLLVICHGDTKSIRVIQKALDEFSKCSGFLPNNAKSTVFFGSLNDNEKQEILNILPFEAGKLPVRYLGVPLIAKRLSVKECGSLLDKIKSKVKNWKNRSLSYAGRLQLIAAVLESLHVYWASVFLIPATIIKEINKLLKWFLWNQGDTAKEKAKVAWKEVCKPKDEGGLGLKNLQTWNHALLAKHVWNIAIKKDTLWVKWVHSVKLRGKNIWGITTDFNDSWGWNNLLYIRDLIKSNVKCIIGNEGNASLWFDNWSNSDPLFQYISQRDLYDARLTRELNVIHMISNGQWRWPTEWFDKFPMITQLEVPKLDANSRDKFMWRNRNGQILDFSVGIANIDLCFVLLISCRNRVIVLLTDAAYDENSLVLENIIQYLSNDKKDNNIKSILRKLLFAASIYSIWQERNGRIFRNQKRSCEKVYKSIVDLIKLKLLGLTVKDSVAVREIESMIFNGLVSNILESSGYDCTHLVVFTDLLGLGRKLDCDDERRMDGSNKEVQEESNRESTSQNVVNNGGSVLGVLEDMIRVGKAMDGCMKDFEYIIGSSGGILCVWEASVFKKDYATISDNFIAIYGTWLPSNSKILFVAIYAPQQASLKRVLWDYVSILLGRWNGEVIIMGDFNEVRSEDERRGSVFNPSSARIFDHFIFSSGLVDVKLEGYAFTWSHPSASKMSKLDRFLVSEGILSLFPSITAICLDRHLSDHRPILLRE